jgi:equilibrative nucleoside transporter 1/2/3
MTARGFGHRRPSTDNAYYHAVPQSPLAPNPVALSESLVLDPENDDNVVEETVMAVEATPAIRWVHFIFGCAVLLPWNGTSPQNRCSMFTDQLISLTAMITATPYFLSQLEGSPLQHVFPSYMSLIFTASNFVLLAHATATAKQV